MLSWVVVEAKEHLEVVRELVGGLRPLRPELDIEGLRGLLRAAAVLGLANLGEHALRERLDRLRQGIEDVGDLVHLMKRSS